MQTARKVHQKHDWCLKMSVAKETEIYSQSKKIYTNSTEEVYVLE